MTSKKRLLLLAALLSVAALFIVALTWNTASSPTVVVYKSPTCGCCAKWVEHLEAAGFTVEVHDRTDMAAVKAHYGIGQNLGSCHTAVVDGYLVEGHVPATYVAQLLAERPAIAGLAVPGMPMGSPGMEGAYRDAYDVVALDKAGNTSVYAHVPAN